MSKVMPKAYRPEIAKEVARGSRGLAGDGSRPDRLLGRGGDVSLGSSDPSRRQVRACGHKHRTKAAALRCSPKTTRLQPGNCARYEVQRREGFAIRRVKK